MRSYVSVALAICLGVLLSSAFDSSGSHGSSSPAPTTTPSSVEMEELRAHLLFIEHLLGLDREAADLQAPDNLRDDYRRLVERAEVLVRAYEDELQSVPTLSPVEDGRITSPYTPERFHPVHREVRPHYGLDIATDTGEPIRATADGVVVAAEVTPSYGRALDVRHGERFVTRYAHASDVLVAEGDSVARGDTIARVGATGTATGPHVHYEIFHDGWSVDPIDFLLDSTVSIPAEAR